MWQKRNGNHLTLGIASHFHFPCFTLPLFVCTVSPPRVCVSVCGIVDCVTTDNMHDSYDISAVATDNLHIHRIVLPFHGHPHKCRLAFTQTAESPGALLPGANHSTRIAYFACISQSPISWLLVLAADNADVKVFKGSTHLHSTVLCCCTGELVGCISASLVDLYNA